MTLTALGDAAVVLLLGNTIDPGTASRVRATIRRLRRSPPRGMVECFGAFASVGIFYDPTGIGSYAEFSAEVLAAANAADAEAAGDAAAGKIVEIPVCYGGEFGPDLAAVAAHTRLKESEVIARHAGADYLVHAIGFSPGFPYLGGLAPELHVPRRPVPRLRVAAGSVGIGGAQTGVYPVATPGGWNLIGRTPLALFEPGRESPVLLSAGDTVRFRPIDAAEFARRTSGGRTPAGGGAAEVPAGTAIEVVRAGQLTTVQDGGRCGWRGHGVALGGACDPFAQRVANAVVGNVSGTAGLEWALAGPELRFEAPALVAVAGGDFGVPRGRPLALAAGETLRLGAARSGCRGFLAVAGGLPVPPLLGGRGTAVREGFGGWAGRVLQAGDRLPFLPHAAEPAGWFVDPQIYPAYAADVTVRVLPGAEAPEFPPDWLGREFKVSPQSDRTGLRLAGPRLARASDAELVSRPVAPGTIQVPPDGQPIVLLADAQTIGGYPQLAYAITVDLPLLAQLRPGDTVRFREVTLDEAHAVLVAQEESLGWLGQGLALQGFFRNGRTSGPARA